MGRAVVLRPAWNGVPRRGPAVRTDGAAGTGDRRHHRPRHARRTRHLPALRHRPGKGPGDPVRPRQCGVRGTERGVVPALGGRRLPCPAGRVSGLRRRPWQTDPGHDRRPVARGLRLAFGAPGGRCATDRRLRTLARVRADRRARRSAAAGRRGAAVGVCRHGALRARPSAARLPGTGPVGQRRRAARLRRPGVRQPRAARRDHSAIACGSARRAAQRAPRMAGLRPQRLPAVRCRIPPTRSGVPCRRRRVAFGAGHARCTLGRDARFRGGPGKRAGTRAAPGRSASRAGDGSGPASGIRSGARPRRSAAASGAAAGRIRRSARR